ncbi:MAG TPA: tol-pal system protein YbgF [Thermoanaerobaculia bacterium]|nr:tol-pal system protein YbgF [Thermoanaerobaculia bacterium]
MRQFAAVVTVLALGCASSPDMTPPQPQPSAPADDRLVSLQTSMTELLERLDVINDRLARLEQSRETGALPSPPVPQTQAVPGPQSPIVSATSSALRGAQLAEQYRSAIMLYGARRVGEARAEFQRVFDADPSSELADNALFWIGETYYTAGDYQNAISYYQRVSQQYGDQNKAPDAVYKMAMAYARTGDLVLARNTFQEVIARYPYSTPAASAKAELERIKY